MANLCCWKCKYLHFLEIYAERKLVPLLSLLKTWSHFWWGMAKESLKGLSQRGQILKSLEKMLKFKEILFHSRSRRWLPREVSSDKFFLIWLSQLSPYSCNRIQPYVISLSQGFRTMWHPCPLKPITWNADVESVTKSYEYIFIYRTFEWTKIDLDWFLCQNFQNSRKLMILNVSKMHIYSSNDLRC